MQCGMWGEWMDVIYEWVRSLMFFLILTTMVVNLLPDKKYEKYLRLYIGAVFLILVFSPLANLSGAGEQVAEAFARITFQNEAKVLQREIQEAGVLLDEELEQKIGEYDGLEKNDMEIHFEVE